MPDAWEKSIFDWCADPVARLVWTTDKEGKSEQVEPILESTNERILITELLQHGVGLLLPMIKHGEVVRASNVLTRAGWRTHRERVKGHRETLYFCPGSAWAEEHKEDAPKKPALRVVKPPFDVRAADQAQPFRPTDQMEM